MQIPNPRPYDNDPRLRYLDDAERFYQRVLRMDKNAHTRTDAYVANLIAMGQFALAMAESQVPA